MSNKIIPEEWQTPTMYLVFINIGMYIITTLVGGNFILTGSRALILFGLSIRTLSAGWIWTPFTSIITHAHIGHIGSNMIFLMIFGFRLEEKKYSSNGIYTAYLITGITSGILSLLIFYSTNSVTAGASGSVFGLIGVNSGIDKRNRDPNYRKVLWLSIILFIMSSGTNTNVFAHFFGLVIGYYLGKSDWFDQYNQSHIDLR